MRAEHGASYDWFREEMGRKMPRRPGRESPDRPRRREEEQAADGRQLGYFDN